ncbi:MAG TPA: glycosyltransferase family 39 protein, partial [Pirellulales bacterium]|nr:glycosyltransferase family 39 protein [Pirellulales bacterium]
MALLLFAAFALAAGSAAQKSVTVDEFQGLPLGLATLKTGDAHLGVTNPLLPSVMAALPLLATSARFDPAPVADYTSSWQTGGQFLRENVFAPDVPPESRGRYQDDFLLGRLVSIAVLLASCGLAYGYARSLYGPAGGLVAAAFCCFSPNLLAHGPLVTPDIYLTAAIVGSLWAFDCLLRKPDAKRTLVLSAALGLAALAKLTGLLLLGLFPALLVAIQLAARLRPRADETDAEDFRFDHSKSIWLALLAACALAVVVINIAYVGSGSFAPLGEYELASRQLQFFQRNLPGWLPVPLPRYFFLSIDAQWAEEGYTAYLLGQFNEQGFYYYYLVGLLVKTPLPVMLLALLACFWGGPLRRRELLLVGAGAALFCFFSLARHKNIGMRYVLFLEPLTAI